MNKKLSIALAAALLAVATTTAAHAADDGWALNPHVYVGGDYQNYSIDYGKGLSSVLQQDLSGYDFHVGVNANKYLGAEVSYFGTESGKKNLGAASTTIQLSGFALDGFGYVDKYEYSFTGGANVIMDATVGTSIDKWRGTEFDYVDSDVTIKLKRN